MAKAKSSSTEVQSEIYRSAGEQLIPPPEAGGLTDDELRVFDLVGKSRATLDWSQNDLLLLAQYSQLTVHLQEAHATLRSEGDVTFNQRGTPVANPMFAVCDSLLRQQLSLVRILGIAGGLSGADKETYANRAGKQSEAEKNKKSNKISLLAQPDA